MIRGKVFRGIIGGLAILFAIVVYRCATHDTYEDVLAFFGVTPVPGEPNEPKVVANILALTPVGSSHARVVAVLDSLGFRRASKLNRRRPQYSADSGGGMAAIRAIRPFSDECLSLMRFVCDPPAMGVRFSFDADWKLTSVQAGAGRGCL